MAVPHDVRQPKVGYLDVHLRVQQQVLWLQVSVHHLQIKIGLLVALTPDSSAGCPLRRGARLTLRVHA